MKKYTPLQLIEFLVENDKRELHKKMPLLEQFVLVYPQGGRHMAKVYLKDNVPTVSYCDEITPLQLIDPKIIFEEFVTCR